MLFTVLPSTIGSPWRRLSSAQQALLVLVQSSGEVESCPVSRSCEVEDVRVRAGEPGRRSSGGRWPALARVARRR
ncbi:hypothetical protein [Nonomuraea lactucae]|uniref:hypothetical protein n=1 Tax=Nonomuraea lactucae TaxID=2249762 RepID=UPI0013B39BD2|nr:hypothetical protein [Nonomuraea lactucae]